MITVKPTKTMTVMVRLEDDYICSSVTLENDNITIPITNWEMKEYGVGTEYYERDVLFKLDFHEPKGVYKLYVDDMYINDVKLL